MGETTSSSSGLKNDLPSIEILKVGNIDTKLIDLEERTYSIDALSLMHIFQPKKYTIDIAYDNTSKKYYIISGDKVLRIPLDIKFLEEYLKIVKKLLDSNNELINKGRFNSRLIYEYGFFSNKFLYGHIDSGDNRMGRTDEIRWANDLVEELFLFAKLVKGEKINSSNTSKSALTSPDGTIHGAIDPNLGTIIGVRDSTTTRAIKELLTEVKKNNGK